MTVELRSERVLLRALRPSDVDERQALGRRVEVNRGFGGDLEVDGEMSTDQAQAWYLRETARDPETSWAIEHDGRFIGTARLHSVDRHDLGATYAIGILDAGLLGQGLGTEATQLVLTHAFDTLGLHRIDLRVLATNERAIGCYRRCGFVEEGRERASALVRGERVDDVRMAVLATDDRDAPPPEVVALDHVQLAMPRGLEDEAEDFYCGLLGFTRLPKPEPLASRGGCWFAAGAVQLHLGVEDEFRPARQAHPALRVTALVQLAERLDAAGHPVRWTDELPGPLRGYVDDPFGNRIELIDS